jgi:hypothetical protein
LQVDFLPAQGLSEDEVAQLRRAQEAAAAATRAAKAVIDGEERSFKVRNCIVTWTPDRLHSELVTLVLLAQELKS